MQNFRIIELPRIKAAYSGLLDTQEKFIRFNEWFSAFHAAQKFELYPRDFMRYNEAKNAHEWFYALPAGACAEDCGGFEIRDLPGGLFAVASCTDADLDEAKDWMRTREQLIEYVKGSDRFTLYENGQGAEERYPMFHIVSPGRLIDKGIAIEDMYMLICEKCTVTE